MAIVKVAHTVASTGLRIVDRYQDIIAPGIGDDANDDVVAGTLWDMVDANGVLVTRYICTDPTAGAAVWKTVESDDQNKTIGFIEEVVIFSGTATKNLVTQIPAGATPLIAVVNCDTLVACTTAVKIGVGTSADPDGYCKTGALTKNTKGGIKGALIGIQVAAATTVQVTSVDTAGALAGTADTGTFRVRVYYEQYDQLADAA